MNSDDPATPPHASRISRRRVLGTVALAAAGAATGVTATVAGQNLSSKSLSEAEHHFMLDGLLGICRRIVSHYSAALSERHPDAIAGNKKAYGDNMAFLDEKLETVSDPQQLRDLLSTLTNIVGGYSRTCEQDDHLLASLVFGSNHSEATLPDGIKKTRLPQVQEALNEIQSHLSDKLREVNNLLYDARSR